MCIVQNVLLTNWSQDKMADHLQTSFSNVFSEKNKHLYFLWSTTHDCSYGTKWQQVSIVSANGLGPSRQQSITWIIGDQYAWRHMQSLRRNGLTKMMTYENKHADDFLLSSKSSVCVTLTNRWNELINRRWPIAFQTTHLSAKFRRFIQSRHRCDVKQILQV